jgi:TonB-dependent SusC/RagA subfamily outer membrane receptor
MRPLSIVRASLLVALTFLFAHPVSAQQVPANVAGTVADASTLQPLSGALVVLQGTNRSVLTDAQGRFNITGIEGQAGTVTLRVQLIGYATSTTSVPLGTQNASIMLQQSAISLEGVVVSALGIEREARALGYSVATATPEQMTENRTAHVMDALTGKIAGVSITPLGSGPSGSSKVRIRGQSSMGANNSPLIVVNGVPLDNTTFGVTGDFGERGRNRNSDSGDGLSSINPDDVAEMTVLKGAAASALYGARAKDGVIMITTRNRADGEGLQFELNTNFMHESVLDYRDFQYEYGQGETGCRPWNVDRPEGTPESGGRPLYGRSGERFGCVELRREDSAGDDQLPVPGARRGAPLRGAARPGEGLLSQRPGPDEHDHRVAGRREWRVQRVDLAPEQRGHLPRQHYFERTSGNLGFTQRSRTSCGCPATRPT